MLTKKVEYGYIILQKLKKLKKDELKSGKEILDKSEIPYNMGLGILTILVKKGLVISRKGKTGGFYLNLDTELNMLDLFLALEGDVFENNLDEKFIDMDYQKIVFKLGQELLVNLKNIKI